MISYNCFYNLKFNFPGVFVWRSGLGIPRIFPAVASVAAVVRVQSPAPELPYASGVAQKKKKKFNFLEECDRSSLGHGFIS